jgi:hypothetical protein
MSAFPFHPTGHSTTKLTQDSAAIIGWYEIIHIGDDCRFMAGDIPQDVMSRINEEAHADIARRIGKKFKTIDEVIPLIFGDDSGNER